MSRTVSLVQRIEIASPCHSRWEEMTGDDRVRHCTECRLNVYNLSAMSSVEVERLMHDKEGRLCARLFRRADGTIITQDCPVGVAAARRVAVRLVAIAAGAAACVLATAVWGMNVVAGSRSSNRWTHNPVSAYARTKTTVQGWLDRTPQQTMTMTMGVIAPPRSTFAFDRTPLSAQDQALDETEGCGAEASGK